MSDNSLVSVITPCYNDGKYILECIKSVYSSDYPNVEHIIIDDGSTDDFTLEILRAIKKDEYPNLTIIFSENKGVCIARNTAIAQSKGKYILPLDSDDMISSGYISSAIEILEQNPLTKVVTTNYKLIGRKKKTIVLEPYSLERLLGHNLFINCSMFRRYDFDTVGGYNVNMKKGLEDWDLWIALLKTGGGVHYLNTINFFYRMKPCSKSRNNSISKLNHINLRKQIWENHKEMFSQYFINPFEMEEYLTLKESIEYRVGSILLAPLRFIFKSGI